MADITEYVPQVVTSQ